MYIFIHLELPYDRSLLSKGMSGQAPGPIRNEESLENNGIYVLKGSNVTGIDYNSKNVSIEGQESLSYDKLLIATGVSNRIPPIQGLNTVPFFTLRNKKDYNNIKEALSAPGVKNVTIIGGGFIGMETASAIKLAFKDANVTVLEGQNAPLTHVLGEKVGTVLQKLSEKNGVKIITNAKISSIQSEGSGSQVNL